MNQTPGSSGPRFVTDTAPFHNRLIEAIPHVRRQRKLAAIWRELSPHDRAVLEQRYRKRQYVGILGVKAVFGELAGVALYLARVEGKLEELIRAVGSQANLRHSQLVTEFRVKAEAASKGAHLAWQNAKRSRASKWVEEERP